MIGQEVIERVRAETDIVELIGGYLPLRKVGRNFRGVCPFHPDRSPSFYVSPERQTYHCFGCGAGGNAVSFVMERDNLAFPEAVKLLAERIGIAVADSAPDRYQGIFDACELATSFYERVLRQNDAALRYLVQRRISPDVVKRFRLGYAPPGNRLRGEVKRRSWRLDDFRQAGLITDRGRGPVDYFGGRVMFPIFSPAGKVIAFGGRVLEDREPKYLNSPETPLFHKGEGLYGLFQAKAYLRDAPAVLVEGNFDLLALVGCGFRNVVAPLGTAITPGQSQLIRRYTGRVRVCFDGDDAGQHAARRSLESLLRAGLDPLVVQLPSGLDPDDVVRSAGRDRFAELLDQAVDFVDFATGGAVPKNVADQRALLGELATLTASIPDPATRELYSNRIAAMFDVSKRALLPGTRGWVKPETKSGERPGLEERLVAAIVQDAELARMAGELGLAGILVDEELRAIARVAAERCEDDGYGPAMLLDRFEDAARRRRIAGWTFAQDRLPSPAEFRVRVQRMRAARLQREIIENCEQEHGDRAERLLKERAALLRTAARGGEADEQEDEQRQ